MNAHFVWMFFLALPHCFDPLHADDNNGDGEEADTGRPVKV